MLIKFNKQNFTSFYAQIFYFIKYICIYCLNTICFNSSFIHINLKAFKIIYNISFLIVKLNSFDC